MARALEAAHPGLAVALVGIETRGDVVQQVPLRSAEGSAFFTAEIDHALIAGEIDLAVHSLKDLSLDRPAALCVAAVPRRENPRDVVLFAPDIAESAARGKQTHLEFLERHAIGRANALALTSSQLVRHIQSRRADGAGLATASNDLTWIGVVLRAAKSVEGVTVRPQIVQEARIACREFRLIGKSRRRERRPTVDELAKLDAHFATRDRRASLPRIRHFGVSVCGPFRERNDVKSDEVDHGHEHQLAEPAGKPALEKIFRTARG